MVDASLANAIVHRRGTITARVDAIDGAAGLRVSDRGRLDGDPTYLFARRVPDAQGSGIGIGLHVARALVEAEGGRLRLVGTDPTTAGATRVHEA